MPKYGPVVIIAVALAIAFTRDYYTRTPVLRSYDSLVLSKDSADAVIREHGDSAKERIKIVYVQQDRSAAIAIAAKALDSLAQISVQSRDWELAHQYEKRRADTLDLALKVSQRATENALAAASFRELQFMADSTRRAEEWQVTMRLAVAAKPKWYQRCGVMVGVSVRGRGLDLMAGCKAYP